MFCHNCGKEIDNNLKKCPYCGADLIYGNSTVVSFQKNKKHHKLILVFSFVVIIVVAFFIIKSFIEKEYSTLDETVRKELDYTKDVIPNATSAVIDVETYMNEPLDNILELGDFQAMFSGSYETMDDQVIVDADNGLISRIEICETQDYSFHQISYGMDSAAVQQLLSTDYQYDVAEKDAICFWKSPYYEMGGYIYLDENNNCEQIVIMTDFQQELVHYKYNRGYIIFDSVYRKLTEEDLEGMDSYQLENAVDEIYARAGMRFADLEKLERFSRNDWYDGVINEDEFSDSDLSEVEKYNINFLNQKIQIQKEIEGMMPEDFIGIYKNEEMGYLIKIMPKEENPDDIYFEIYEEDVLYIKETDAEIEENYIQGGEYVLTKNTDGSITLQIDGGGVIGDFVKE